MLQPPEARQKNFSPLQKNHDTAEWIRLRVSRKSFMDSLKIIWTRSILAHTMILKINLLGGYVNGS